MKKFIIYVCVVIFILFVGIQFVPVNFTNPPITKEINAPENVKAILKRSCYDCHSNLTKWPWYNKIAPISWLIKRDVTNGRANMNFTEWDIYESIEQDMKEMIVEAVKMNKMPPFVYRMGHPDARLSEKDITILEKWAKGELK
jgi:hypothetical protein